MAEFESRAPLLQSDSSRKCENISGILVFESDTAAKSHVELTAATRCKLALRGDHGTRRRFFEKDLVPVVSDLGLSAAEGRV